MPSSCFSLSPMSTTTAYLIFGCIIELWIVPLGVPVVQQVVVDQIPAPALVIAAQEGDVAVAVVGGLFSGYPDDSHRAQGTLPDNLPGVSTSTEPELAPGPIRGLGHGVPVQGKPVRFDVDISGNTSGSTNRMKWRN